MQNESGNYFEDLNKLFSVARDEENIVVDEQAKFRIRENLAYKINNIKVHGWESPVGLFLKDKVKYAAVAFPVLLLGIFTTFAAVGYIEIPFIRDDEKGQVLDDDQNNEIALNTTVRDTELPERLEEELPKMEESLDAELPEEDNPIIETTIETPKDSKPVESRKLNQEKPPLLVLDINEVGQEPVTPSVVATQPQEQPHLNNQENEENKPEIALSEEIFTNGGGFNLVLNESDDNEILNISEESEDSEDSGEREVEGIDESQDNNTDEDENKVIQETDQSEIETSDNENEQTGDQDSLIAQNETSDNKNSSSQKTHLDDAKLSEEKDNSTDSDKDTDSNSDDNNEKPYMVAYLVPKDKELEALTFSNTVVDSLVIDNNLKNQVEQVTIEYIESDQIQVAIKTNELTIYHTFVKDGVKWNEKVIDDSITKPDTSTHTQIQSQIDSAVLKDTLKQGLKVNLEKINIFN